MFPSDSDRDRDALADALALVECAHRRDFDGMVIVMRHGNLVLTAAALARVAADLVTVFVVEPACDGDFAEAEAFAALRSAWLR